MSVKSAPISRVVRQGGFVLVLTLWVLVIVAIAAGYFSERVARATQLANQSRQNAQAVIDMAGTRADILYRLSTTTMTEFGLGRGNATLYLDNRPYHGLGNSLVQLQDTRGLLGLNQTDDDRLQRFLGLLGIPAAQRGPMIDTLRDYIDADKLHRLNGAESEAYLALNLPAPANKNLVTPWEAKRIIGWRNVPQLWQKNRLIELTTTGLSLGINPNTAPTEVLATLPGISEEIAQIIIERRKISPITHEGQLVELTQMPMGLAPGTGVIAIPSDTIRITQSTQDNPWAIQYSLSLTPNSKEGPWRVDYYSRVSHPRHEEARADKLELPPRSTAPPDKAPAFLFGGTDR